MLGLIDASNDNRVDFGASATDFVTRRSFISINTCQIFRHRPFLAFGVAGGLRDLGAARVFEGIERVVLAATGLEGNGSAGSAGETASKAFRILYAWSVCC